MKLGATIRAVKNCMGIAYGEAVEFCLRQSNISHNPAWAQLQESSDSGRREEAYKSLLKEFHQDVFLR
ncbi:Peptidase m43 pregnancy-associated plasma-a [Lasiodiplodia theobromae]|uniref:Peptidase m43 pregnancy-associated plasma-a n=1 Tax=Lasiodiplodia theobromae TaxID=45133 RepID=UPI0015C40C7C|nr:Peptidase m43 pregnancy-associated plasma-a [Lasiodiplodia theobromae]KAF4540664.1 Peptidase m43 pregnancy-associated plasma-a [Lasiodiplodia theobromae]